MTTGTTGASLTPRRRTVRLPSAAEERFAERVGLFALAVAGDGARPLLDGMRSPLATEAVQAFDSAKGLDAPARRARVAQALGPRPEAPKRFEWICRSATPELCAALREAAPSYLRELVPASAARASAPVRALAARLVREALG